jgi:alpha-galactosidase
MLSTTSGTLGTPAWESYRDAVHYRIPEPADALTAYGMVLLSPPYQGHLLIGFLSCKRFVGAINIWPDRVRVGFDAENISIAPGERWVLDPVILVTSADRDAALAAFAERTARLNQARADSRLHTGWSSWNALGENLHFDEVLANALVVAARATMLDYIQIDDGYQAAMGDWFDARPDFGGTMADLCAAIARVGKKPAVWVAPLIAERNSNLFREHPDWFIKDFAGAPLNSDKTSFGGWRHGPWYGLDGSHPDVQYHLEQVFRRMRSEWGVDYFKLDALFWGALPGGSFHNPRMSRAEAYRSALAAVRRGAGDAFITVANAPLWPTIGFADASRASNDVRSSWSSFKLVGRQNLRRSWMHRRLWVTDPDSIMLGGNATENEFRVHWTAVYISGGIFLTGDDLTKARPERLDILQRLGRPTGFKPRVEDERLEFVTTDGGPLAVFNWDDQPKQIALAASPRSRWQDFWTQRDLAFDRTGACAVALGPRDALLLHRTRI